jgi:hypothetical protein
MLHSWQKVSQNLAAEQRCHFDLKLSVSLVVSFLHQKNADSPMQRFVVGFLVTVEKKKETPFRLCMANIMSLQLFDQISRCGLFCLYSAPLLPHSVAWSLYSQLDLTNRKKL